jgi:hypothetical protein
MTKTRVGKKVRRETQGPGVFERSVDRAVIVSVEYPNIIGLRLKGTRRTYYLAAESAYVYAARLQVAHDKAEKIKARKLRRMVRT